MKYRLRVAPRAETQIRKAAQWWLENRPKAPHAFEEELEKAFGFIISFLRAAEPVRHSHIDELRRLLMKRVSYYLFYQVNDDSESIEVLALWHTSRDDPPPIR